LNISALDSSMPKFVHTSLDSFGCDVPEKTFISPNLPGNFNPFL